MNYLKLWKKHVEKISQGQPLLTMRFLEEEHVPKVVNMGRNLNSHMVGGPRDDSKLKQIFDSMGKYSSISSPETKEDWEKFLFELGMAFVLYTRGNTPFTIQEYIDAGLDINFTSPKTGRALVHFAASCNATDMVRTLLNTGECDLLIRDNQDDLPYDIAYKHGRDHEMFESIALQTMRQAVAQRQNLQEIFTNEGYAFEKWLLEQAKLEPIPIR